MTIFGKNGFVRKQEVAIAKKILVWKYEKSGMALPNGDGVATQAEKIVDEANMMAKKSGNTVLEVLKNKMKDIKRKM